MVLHKIWILGQQIKSNFEHSSIVPGARGIHSLNCSHLGIMRPNLCELSTEQSQKAIWTSQKCFFLGFSGWNGCKWMMIILNESWAANSPNSSATEIGHWSPANWGGVIRSVVRSPCNARLWHVDNPCATAKLQVPKNLAESSRYFSLVNYQHV